MAEKYEEYYTEKYRHARVIEEHAKSKRVSSSPYATQKNVSFQRDYYNGEAKVQS